MISRRLASLIANSDGPTQELINELLDHIETSHKSELTLLKRRLIDAETKIQEINERLTAAENYVARRNLNKG